MREAEKYAAQGCRYYKMKIHDPDPKANRARVEAVKRAVGANVRLMVDVNQRLDVLGNQRQAAELEHLDLVWYEEPVLADDIRACAEVAQKINIPVATGENNYTRYEFRELIERNAARYLMPDVCRANGFSETLKIGHLAAAHGVAVSPHVVHEISLHVVGTLQNGFLVEYMDWAPPDLFEAQPECRGGASASPTGPATAWRSRAAPSRSTGRNSGSGSQFACTYVQTNCDPDPELRINALRNRSPCLRSRCRRRRTARPCLRSTNLAASRR